MKPDYLESFEDYLLENEKSKNTIQSYLRDVRQFLEFLGSKTLKKVTKTDIKRYKDHLSAKGMKVKSINRKLVSIKQFFAFVNESDLYKFQIVVPIKMEKEQVQNYLDEMLTREDVDNMIMAATQNGDIRAKTIFNTLLYTGLRVSEMLQLTVDDVEKKDVFVKGKGSKLRRVYVSDRVRDVWRDYLKERQGVYSKLFIGQKGSINRYTVNSIIKKYAKIAGVEESRAHAHNFRHLFCQLLIDKGISIDEVADLAGHSDINTTRIYTRRTTEELTNTINML